MKLFYAQFVRCKLSPIGKELIKALELDVLLVELTGRKCRQKISIFYKDLNDILVGANRIMPKFLDSHPMQGARKDQLKKLQEQPVDEFGVKHIDIIFSEDDDRMYCFLEAPNKDSIVKHHKKAGYTCDFIIEVDSTAYD